MAGNKSKRSASDRRRINMHEPYEVLYWREKFGVSEDELQRAVARVGSSAGPVEQDLKLTHTGNQVSY